MAKQILFLCPHNAAKSVMAAAYFSERMRGSGIEAFSAGTEPDEHAAPHVVALLEREGYGAAYEPSRVSRADFEKADRIISIGCALQDLPATDKDVTQWDDVPPPSQDLEGAWRRIKECVDGLIDQLHS